MKKPPVRKQRAPMVERERRAHLNYPEQRQEVRDETARRIWEALIVKPKPYEA